MDSDTYASPHLSIWQITVISHSDLGWLNHKRERTEAHAFSVGCLWTQGNPRGRSVPGNSKTLSQKNTVSPIHWAMSLGLVQLHHLPPSARVVNSQRLLLLKARKHPHTAELLLKQTRSLQMSLSYLCEYEGYSKNWQQKTFSVLTRLYSFQYYTPFWYSLKFPQVQCILPSF